MAESRDFSMATYSVVSLNATEWTTAILTGMLGTSCDDAPLTDELLHADKNTPAARAQPSLSVRVRPSTSAKVTEVRCIPRTLTRNPGFSTQALEPKLDHSL